DRILFEILLAFDASGLGLLIARGTFAESKRYVEIPAERIRHSHGASQSDGICNHSFISDGICVSEGEFFDNMDLVAVNGAIGIPPSRHLARGIDSQDVTFELTDGITLIQLDACRNVLPIVEINHPGCSRGVPSE